MEILDKLPVATLIVVVLAIVGGVDIVVDGKLSPDFREYAEKIGVAAGLLGIGRGVAAAGKRR